jgi:ribosomal protein L14E/L6E/L27E
MEESEDAGKERLGRNRGRGVAQVDPVEDEEVGVDVVEVVNGPPDLP